MLANVLTRNWGWVALRGVVAVLFGLLTFFYPAITLVSLVLFFGAYALVDGVFMVVGAIANRRGERRWVALLVGGLLHAWLWLLPLPPGSPDAHSAPRVLSSR